MCYHLSYGSIFCNSGEDLLYLKRWDDSLSIHFDNEICVTQNEATIVKMILVIHFMFFVVDLGFYMNVSSLLVCRVSLLTKRILTDLHFYLN